jgi:hypothetical protein
VSGVVELKGTHKRPVLSKGFVDRRENPIRPAAVYDPRSEVVVVLVDGEIAEEDKEPPGQVAQYDLLGEAFAAPLFAVQVGREIDVKNRSKNSPRLFSPDDAKLLDADPINPEGIRSFKLAEPFRAMRIQARDSAHLIGRVVAFPSPYFAPLGAGGKFQIEGVPAGKWRLRLWYRDGWVDGADKSVDVVAKKETKLPPFPLPAPLAAKPPQAAAGAEKEP